MPEALLSAAGFGTSVFSMCLAALSQERHWNLVAGTSEPLRWPAYRLRIASFSLQAVAYTLFVLGEDIGFGVLMWGISLTATSMIVALSLSWSPSLLRPVARLLAAST